MLRRPRRYELSSNGASSMNEEDSVMSISIVVLLPGRGEEND